MKRSPWFVAQHMKRSPRFVAHETISPWFVAHETLALVRGIRNDFAVVYALVASYDQQRRADSNSVTYSNGEIRGLASLFCYCHGSWHTKHVFVMAVVLPILCSFFCGKKGTKKAADAPLQPRIGQLRLGFGATVASAVVLVSLLNLSVFSPSSGF